MGGGASKKKKKNSPKKPSKEEAQKRLTLLNNIISRVKPFLLPLVLHFPVAIPSGSKSQPSGVGVEGDRRGEIKALGREMEKLAILFKLQAASSQTQAGIGGNGTF